MHEGRFDYKCDRCGIPYQSASALQYHIGRKHSENPIESNFARRKRKEEEMIAIAKNSIEKSEKLILDFDPPEAAQIQSIVEARGIDVVPTFDSFTTVPLVDSSIFLLQM